MQPKMHFLDFSFSELNWESEEIVWKVDGICELNATPVNDNGVDAEIFNLTFSELPNSSFSVLDPTLASSSVQGWK